MNHLSPIVAQKLKCFVRWITHEDRPYDLDDDFLATLTRERYLKFRHMVTEFRQPLQVQSHLEMPRILVQLGHIQRT